MEAVVEQSEPVVSSAPRLPVSSETVGELVRHIEAKHDLLQYEVDGWCVWPVLRFPVALALLDLPFTKSREAFRLRELLFLAAKDLPDLIFPRKALYAAVTLSSALMEREGERYKDVFFDDLLRELGSFFKIESINSKGFLPRSRAALIKSNVTSTAFDLLSSLVLPKFSRLPSLKSIAEKISASLRQETGLDAFSPQDIAGRLEGFYWRKKLYSWLLGRTDSKYLFSADGYSDHAIFAAAKERGMRVCEFQHGGFIKGGPEYGWSSYAASYRPRMPIPDQIFVFGEYWKQQLDFEEFWEGRLFAVGNLRMDQYRKRKAEFQSSRQDETFKIVLTAQGIDTQKLIAFVHDFLKLAEDKLEINLYIKLHPVYESDKEIYERAFPQNERVHVISGSEEPSTFELLASADLHLSISSACHYDALGLGVPTVIIPLANSGWVLPLHRAGHAFLAPAPKDLLEIVLQLGHSGVPDTIGSYYFRPGALENMKRALEA
jgi:hypothetical protein